MFRTALITTVAAVLTLPFGAGASANETTRLFGSSSWQFKTPGDRLVDDGQLILRCNREGDFRCFSAGASTATTVNAATAATAGGSGPYAGTAAAIANQISITVTGDGNTVTTDSTQDNAGEQAATITVSGDESTITVDGIEHDCTNCDVNQ